MITALLFLLASPDIGTLKDGVIHLNAQEAAQLLAQDDDVIVLDVRTRGEYRHSHIDGAVQINYFSLGFKKRLKELDQGAAYLVHCRTGHRSGRTVRILKDLGAETIYHLDGGIVAWRKAGLPLERQAKEATE